MRNLRVAIIGAGASGILALIKFREAGIEDVTVFEKAASIGGTWRENTYPGLSCDVPSHLYRYTFAPNPDWSHVCSPGPEILEYLQRVVARHDVMGFIQCGHEALEARFEGGQWRLTTTQGDQGLFDVVLTAVGLLHHPVLPDIEGVGAFAGPAFHSARWDHTAAIDGKRVGIIGTGSTATQIVGAITPRVGKLSLFQRTAQWIMPLQNTPIPEEQKARFRDNPEALEAEYQRLAQQFLLFAGAVAGDNDAHYAFMCKLVEDNLEQSVHDPVLREKLRPTYKLGCKRIIVSEKFYASLQMPNAELVTDPIERIEAEGVRTKDGRLHPIDVLVYATGFNTHQFMRPMKVVGPERTLDEAWARGNEGYLGVSIAGFPNFFMIGGPNSPISTFSWLQTAEAQCGYILQLMQKLRDGNVTEIAPKASAVQRFNSALKAQMPKTVWASGCRSWYLDQNGDVASWPWSFEKFARDMQAPAFEDFEMR